MHDFRLFRYSTLYCLDSSTPVINCLGRYIGRVTILLSYSCFQTIVLIVFELLHIRKMHPPIRCCLGRTTSSLDGYVTSSREYAFQRLSQAVYDKQPRSTIGKQTRDYFVICCFVHPIQYISPSGISLSVVTKFRVHMALSSRPVPLRYAPCVFVAARLEHFLPSSTRVELCAWARRSLSAAGVFREIKNFIRMVERLTSTLYIYSNTRNLPIDHQGDLMYSRVNLL